MPNRSVIRTLFVSSFVCLVLGCGASGSDAPISSSTGGKPASSGGAKSTGGTRATGGTVGNTGGTSGTTAGTATTAGKSSTGGGMTGGKSSAGGTSSMAGASTTGGMATTGGTSTIGGNTTTGGTTSLAGGTTSTTAGTTGTSGGTTGTTGGTKATGGTTGTTGGTSGTTGGTTGTTGGTTGTTGGSGTTGGTGPGVSVSPTCTALATTLVWPTPTGSTVTISGTRSVTGVYDGGGALHEGTLNDCSTGDQSSTDPILEVANGGTVMNVIMGNNVGDGIHCLGSCTIENVWFPYVCDDAISALGSGTVNISNSGFKNARDKTIQHNGTATVNINNVYVETAGKLYRSCGEGCSSGARTANISNVLAIGVDQIAGASTSDTVTLKNICAYRTAAVCTTYAPGTSTEATNGANGTNDGPSANCIFTAADVHALVNRVTGVSFTTDALCGGPNGYKTGSSSATACVTGFDKCLKMCMPGGYGFKELTCSGGLYTEGTGVVCAMPTDSTAATNLAGTRVGTATNTVTKNANCSTEWATGVDSSNTANYCVCVKKPGYYSFSNWLAWDCQSRWW